jgi:hypothetical protein
MGLKDAVPDKEEILLPTENVQQVYGQVFTHFQFSKSSDFFMDNVFYHRKYESDFIASTKAGYVTEVEIKMSVADFRADFRKGHVAYKDRKRIRVYKHAQLQAGGLGVKYFYFAAPLGVIPVEEVPEKVGLLEVYICGRTNLVGIKITKPARQLPKPVTITAEKKLRLLNKLMLGNATNRRAQTKTKET